MNKFLAIFMALLMFSSGYLTARGGHHGGNGGYAGHGLRAGAAGLAVGAVAGAAIAGAGSNNSTVVYEDGVEYEN